MERTKFKPMNFSSILFGFENPPPFNYQRITHTTHLPKKQNKKKIESNNTKIETKR
jgi:hypothetical protein